MPGTQNHSLINRKFDQAFNQGNLAAVDEWLNPNHLSKDSFGVAPNGREGLKSLITSYRLFFPDQHCIVGDEIGMGDKLAGYWTTQGTHKGLSMGVPPSGKQMQIQGIISARSNPEMIIED